MSTSTKDYGALATELVMESKRSTQTSTLAKYNSTLVRAIQRENTQLESLVVAAHTADGTPRRDMVLYIAIINRNKRCLLAYHQHRVELLKELYWVVGGAVHVLLSTTVPAAGGPGGQNGGAGAGSGAGVAGVADIRARLSPHEVDFLRAYSESVMTLGRGLDVDLFPPIVSPPKDLNINVRVARECGVVQTEVGAMNFKRGHRYQVRRGDVEHLIIQGYLEVV